MANTNRSSAAVPSRVSRNSRRRKPLAPRVAPATTRKEKLAQTPGTPRVQGDGDGLCGLYAIINALRLAFAPAGGLTSAQETEIWSDLVKKADREWNLMTLFLGGTGTSELHLLGRRAAKAASYLTGKKVSYKPFKTSDYGERTRNIKDAASTLFLRGFAALIVGIETTSWGHWTVTPGLTTKSLMLFDSSGRKRVPLQRCQLYLKRKAGKRAHYSVGFYGGFVIKGYEGKSTKRAVNTAGLRPFQVSGQKNLADN